jgi:hypothetical protein
LLKSVCSIGWSIDTREQKRKTHVIKPIPYAVVAGAVTLATIVWSPAPQAQAHAKKAFLEESAPAVFQAAGPTLESIQSAVEQFVSLSAATTTPATRVPSKPDDERSTGTAEAT